MSLALPKPRLTYLDLIKGILVLLMVVYHSLNYTTQFALSFRYLAFLPLSFIFITGFLLSRIYAPRYKPGDHALLTRLFFRGFRLLLLFTTLNVVAQFVRSPAYGHSVGVYAFFARWSEIYVYGASSAAAFDVLLPIAYLILISPLLIAAHYRSTRVLPAVAVAAIVASCTLDFTGVSAANLNFVSIGILGMVAGSLKFDPASLGRWLWLTALAYALYFPLGVARGWIFAIQMLGALLALTFICAGSVRLGENHWTLRRFIRLGQYSLVAYIVQIGLLQVLSRFVGRPEPISYSSFALFAATLVLMTTAIELTEWVRTHSSWADHLYKAIFA